MNSTVIAHRLGKSFRRYHANRPLSFKEWITHGFRWKCAIDSFWALRDITFSVTAGSMLGIIGANGSGKSTLLQLIGGSFPPNEGKVVVKGRVGALIDLGVGFHRDLTGRDNIFIYGAVAGLTSHEIRARFDSIVSFAQLEDFIDTPYRTYSTGMQMRLAFSAAIHTEPDVMLIDEVLAVGDLAFQSKCVERIKELKKSGCTMVIVSHDLTRIKQLCNEVLWIRSGRMAAFGHPEDVIEKYTTLLPKNKQQYIQGNSAIQRTESGIELRLNENRFGSLEMEILGLHTLDSQGRQINEIESGDSVCIEIQYLAVKPIEAPIFGITISSDVRDDYFDISTAADAVVLPLLQGRGTIRLILDRLDLSAGKYFIDVAAYEQNWQHGYDYHWHVYPLFVRCKTHSRGVLLPPHRWELD